MSRIGKQQFNEIRKGITSLIAEYPELGKEIKDIGNLVLTDYAVPREKLVSFNIKNNLKFFIYANAKRYGLHTPLCTSKTSTIDFVDWLLQFDESGKSLLFRDFLTQPGSYLEDYMYEMDPSLEDLEDEEISDTLRDKLRKFLSITSIPARVLGDLYISKRGTVIPASSLPAVFNDCVSEYGLGNISISSLIFYRYDVVKNVLYMDKEYDNDLEVYTFTISSQLNESSSYEEYDYMPRWNSKTWGTEKVIPPRTADRMSSILVGIAEDEGLEGLSQDCDVCKLHMEGNKPILSLGGNKSDTDYGMTAVLLKLCTFPVKEAYVILSSNNSYEVSKLVAKKEKDGEYTLTIY